jgi:minor extracellular serine protease Vpr
MKKSLFSVLMITVLIMMTVFGSVAAQTEEPPLEPLYPAPSAETGEMINETPQLWFVELASKPTVEGTSKAMLDKEKANFRALLVRQALYSRNAMPSPSCGMAFLFKSVQKISPSCPVSQG